MKTIPLVNDDGQVALVDDADYPEVSRYAWRIRYMKHHQVVIVQANVHKATISLHNMIMKPAPGLLVMHIDRDHRNCQRDNLYVPGAKTETARPPALAGSSATEMIRAWLSSGCSWSISTHRQYARTITDFFTFLAARDTKPVEHAALTVSDVAQYLSHVLKNRGRNTTGLCRKTLLQFFTWRRDHYGIDNIVEAIPKITADAPKRRALTETEYRAIMTSTAKPMEKDVIQFLAHTGLKRAEFLALRWPHVADDLTSVHVQGKEGRTIPLSPIARNILAKYDRQGDTIPFVARYGKPSTLHVFCHRVAKCAGILTFDTGALRHYLCARLAKAGVPIQKVSKLLGHSSIAITERTYPRLWAEDLTGVVDVLTN